MCENNCVSCTNGGATLCRRFSHLAELEQKVADGTLVEVVRCKECRHVSRFFNCKGIGVCTHHNLVDAEGDEMIMLETDFCSYGKRKV